MGLAFSAALLWALAVVLVIRRDNRPSSELLDVVRTRRAVKAAASKRLSNESLSNIIRLECNRGDDPSQNLD